VAKRRDIPVKASVWLRTLIAHVRCPRVC